MNSAVQVLRCGIVASTALIACVQVAGGAASMETRLRGRLQLSASAAQDSLLGLRRHPPTPDFSHGTEIHATASLEASSCLEWNTLSAGEFLYRGDAPVVYDPVRHRAIRFGGIGHHSGPANDVWVQDLDSSSGWTLLTTIGLPPPPRSEHGAVYDPVRDRLVIFGGYGDSCDPEEYETCDLNDVWALSLSGIPTWQQISTTGPSPGARRAAAVIYDPARDRMIVSGGSSDAPVYGGTWALSLATSSWTGLAAGPDSHDAGAFYDPTRDRMVLLKGEEPGTVWSLGFSDGSGWTSVTPSGPLPPTRTGCSVVYDPVRDRALMFGGTSPSLYRNDLWELTLSGTPAWNPLNASHIPPPRSGSSALHDATQDQLVIFGGYAINAYADTWVIPLAEALAWSRLFPVESAPTPRNEQAAVWDAPRRRMIVFGGQGSEGASLNDTYELIVADTPVWTRIDATGPLPDPRVSMAAIADAHDRMIVFGGRSEDRFLPGRRFLNDVWAMALSGTPTWTPLAPTGPAPVGRTNPCAAYDPVRDRMIVFGGNDSTGTYLNETWALALAGGTEWHQLTPAGTPPPPMVAAAAVYDPLRDRMLVIGGYQATVGAVNSVWALSLAGDGEWTLLSPVGATPPPMHEASAVYDAQRDRVLVYGDISPSGQVDVLYLAGTPTWSVATIVGDRPTARVGHGAAFDSAGDRMVVFGGADWQRFVYLNDAVALSVSADVSPLVTSADPVEGGTITLDPMSICYANGSSVSLTATPALGYVFLGWTGDATGDVNPLTITMDVAKHVVASFASVPTATLVSRFDAKPSPEGIELRWQLGAPERASALDLERAMAPEGPWHVVAAERRQELGATLVLDREVEPGLEYWYRLRLTLRDGATYVSESISTRSEGIHESAISAVAPNPSPGFSQVHFAIARAGHARLTVVDVAGRSVAILLDSERQPGRYVVNWNANGATRLRAGIYFVRLSASDRTVVRTVAIVH